MLHEPYSQHQGNHEPGYNSKVALTLTAALGLFTAYHQFFRFRGARLVVLDRRGSKPQKSTILKYSSLPAEIRNQYPDYRDPRGHHALVRIPVANEGDRAGYIKLLDVQIKSAAVQGIEKRDQVLFSYYTYTPVPAFGIARTRNHKEDLTQDAISDAA